MLAERSQECRVGTTALCEQAGVGQPHRYLTKGDDPNCRHVGQRPSHIELTARFVIRPTARRAGCTFLENGQPIALAVSLLNRDLCHRFSPRIQHAANQKNRQATEECGRHNRTYRCYRGDERRAK